MGETKTCTITNDDGAPIVKVIKHVINNDGGTAVASAWTLTVSSSNGGTGTGNAAGVESPGTTYTLFGGKQYSVSESGGPSGYTASSSTDCVIPSASVGSIYTCMITNDDQPGTVVVIKHVINDDGGTETASNFSMTVTGTNVLPSATFPGAESPGTTVTLNAGAYSVDESADSGYSKTFGTDCSGSIANGETKTCTITNDDRSGKVIVIKHVVNDSGGTAVGRDFGVTGKGTKPGPGGFPRAGSPRGAGTT